MERRVNVQDVIDALGMAGQLVSINGEPSCSALMALYTDPALAEIGARPVSGVTFNSMDVIRDSLFVCKGALFKEKYLEDAMAAGAACFVREDPDAPDTQSCSIVSDEDAKGAAANILRKAGESGLGIYVRDIRKAMPVIAETFYGKLYDFIRVIGITGTKGKSTTAFFMRSILDDYLRETAGVRSAILSGIENYDGVVDEVSSLTTPEIFEIYRHMDNALKSGIRYMTMEVSSQALKYDRVMGIDFDAVAFLNIGSDHISEIEHPDFDDYLESKLKIFEDCRRACVNLDCEEQARIQKAAEKCPVRINFSQHDSSANIFGYDVVSNEGRVSMSIRGKDIPGYEDFDEVFNLGTFGTINAENALAAVSLAVMLGIPMKHIKAGLAVAVTPGRMEAFYSKDGKRIAIVDYAHNKLSFETFYETIKSEFPDRKIISVFGATGSKGVNRRTDTGKAAGRYSDYTIITEDDPGYEKLEDICDAIAEAVASEGGKYEIIPDRPEAIKKAISMMDDDTLLFVAGKGREHNQKRGTTTVEIPSDIEIVSKYL